MSKLFSISLLLMFCFGNCSQVKTLPNQATTPAKKATTIAFYNVENLFDTEDDPKIDDNEFLPNAPKEWTPERYKTKLAKLTQVLDSIGQGTLPALIGLVEIENEKVLKDLLSQANAQQTYGIIHYDSPDQRGIDVALLYNKALFTPTQSEPLPVVFPFDPETPTRDILYVQGNLNNETIHLFVNHWPSRRDGEEKSEPKRMTAAAVARKKLDAIFTNNPQAKIIMMGDFNDEPHNNSITKGLRAVLTDNTQKTDETMFDLMGPIEQSGQGSYNYQGDWNMLDQFIVSSALLKASKGLRLNFSDAHIYSPDWILYKTGNGDKVPNKTYGGNKYYGGYSDHLPVYLQLRQ